jgi:hypothetical protein
VILDGINILICFPLAFPEMLMLLRQSFFIIIIIIFFGSAVGGTQGLAQYSATK